MKQTYINVDNYLLTQGVNSVVDQFLLNRDKYRMYGISIQSVTDYRNIYTDIPNRNTGQTGVDIASKLKRILKSTFLYKTRYVESQIIREKTINRANKACSLFLKKYGENSFNIICQDAFMCYFLLRNVNDRTNKKIIYMTHIHDDEMEQYCINYPSLKKSKIGKRMRDIFKYVHREVDCIVVICKSAKEALIREGISGSKIKVIYNSSIDCCNEMKFDNTRSDKVKFVMASSITKRKGMDLLADALEMIDNDCGGNVEFHIYGMGDYYSELEKRVAKLKNTVVKLYGRVERPYRFYGDKDVFFMTSRDECLPMSIIEAMSCSLPIFSTDVGAIRELVDGNGDLMKAESSDIARCIRSIADNNGMLHEFGKKSRQLFCERFSNDIWVKEFSDIIK